jgi:hypothetical protein
VWLSLADWLLRSIGSGSPIVSDFPEIFAEFRGKRFSLLWQGSCDGSKAADFHARCDGHANPLTVILDTTGNVFGGFTPVVSESSNDFPDTKAHDNLRSFLFTLKNPRNISPMRFAPKAGERRQPIWCNSRCGPSWGSDIVVSDNFNQNTGSCTSLGTVYTNDTGLDGKTALGGSLDFHVKEIEISEIIE